MDDLVRRVDEDAILSGLEWYGAARRALAEAKRVDEIKGIRDRAVGMRAYAAQAKDRALYADASEITKRAEFELGRMIQSQKTTVGLNEGGRPKTGSLSEPVFDKPATLAEAGIDKKLSSRAQKLFKAGERALETVVSGLRDKIASALDGRKVRGTQGTGENEWFTPSKYIEMARTALGEIDLDPATHARAQEIIKAKKFFTVDDDGLAQPWAGRIWLNPPYAQPMIADFVNKLVGEFSSGSVTEAILLTHNYTDTEWFHTAARAARAICFTRGRIRFLTPDGDEAAPTQGQAFFYFGADDAAFRSAFVTTGFILRP
jgi:hypothetical protein